MLSSANILRNRLASASDGLKLFCARNVRCRRSNALSSGKNSVMIEAQIDKDLKTALLGGDRTQADTLRGLKSALLYAKVEKGKRDSGLSEEEEIAVLAREAKKRSESAELYEKGGSKERAEAELKEKSIIERYLPKQISEAELKPIVDQAISEVGAEDMSKMGAVIGLVKQKTAGSADGALIAKIVKESLSQ